MNIQKKKLIIIGAVTIFIICLLCLYYKNSSNRIYREISSIVRQTEKEIIKYDKYVDKHNYTENELKKVTKEYSDNLEKIQQRIFKIHRMNMAEDVKVVFIPYAGSFTKYNCYIRYDSKIKDDNLTFDNSSIEDDVKFSKEYLIDLTSKVKDACNKHK